MPTNLMGIDVGFSKARRTTGIACLEADHLTLELAGTSWESRKAKIPDGFQPCVIAIDGPLLPLGPDLQVRRHVESVFSRAPFFITVANPDSVIMGWDLSSDRLQVTLA